jgi:hypothetical protein
MNRITLGIVAAVGILCFGVLAFTTAHSLPQQGASSVTVAAETIDSLDFVARKVKKPRR